MVNRNNMRGTSLQHTIPYQPLEILTEVYVEALILAGITNEIMPSEMETIVTYSNHGSAQSRQALI